jgi:hypothetical protein
MKPNFRNLFMKKLTRDRVVPINLSQHLLIEICIDGLRAALLAKIGKQ